ncbi:MAG TPA: flagellar biosynthesis anti-sigma factor FlgM [Bryobacteraceae bacterium]|nr:flagellar biosynthesis anti-sigma factor FlgM [Bryobacteraceae bacterium]
MRLQLDPAVTGAGIGRTGETGQSGAVGAGGDSSRINGRAAGSDSVQISGPSSALNHLASERAARIEQLSALVQGGSYEVSSAKVGGAIVSDAVSGGA